MHAAQNPILVLTLIWIFASGPCTVVLFFFDLSIEAYGVMNTDIINLIGGKYGWVILRQQPIMWTNDSQIHWNIYGWVSTRKT